MAGRKIIFAGRRTMLGRGNAIKSTFDVNEKKTPLSKRPRTTYNSPPLFCFDREDSRRRDEESSNHDSRHAANCEIDSKTREYIRWTELRPPGTRLIVPPLFCFNRKFSGWNMKNRRMTLRIVKFIRKHRREYIRWGELRPLDIRLSFNRKDFRRRDEESSFDDF